MWEQFATPKVLVNVINPPVSEEPFIDPNASAQGTGMVRPPTEQASKGSGSKSKDSKKKHKSSHRKSSKSVAVPVESLPGTGQETTTDTFPQTDPVLLMLSPLLVLLVRAIGELVAPTN